MSTFAKCRVTLYLFGVVAHCPIPRHPLTCANKKPVQMLCKVLLQADNAPVVSTGVNGDHFEIKGQVLARERVVCIQHNLLVAHLDNGHRHRLSLRCLHLQL